MSTTATPLPSATPTPVAHPPEVQSILQAIESFTLAGAQVIQGTHPVISQDIGVGLSIFALVEQLFAQFKTKMPAAPAA